MAIQISLKKGTVDPNSTSGITLAEPVFNTVANTFFIGKGIGVAPIWIGAGICGASGGIAAGLTYQIPTLGAVKDYFTAVSSNFLGTTASYVASFNGSTGAVTFANYVSSFNGSTGAVQGVASFNGSTGAITFSNYAASVNGLTGAIVGVGFTSGKLSQFASTTSAELAGIISDETGSGVLVFGTSPSITTALNTASASFNLLTTNATSLFIGNAATTGRLFGYTGTLAATQSVTVAGANTGSGVNKTVNIGTGSGLNGSVTINIGQAPDEGTGTINLLSNTAVTGTLSTTGNITAPNIVTSFNGRTGAVQGVSAAVAGTGISVSGATGSVTITNTGVQSFNGLTGAVAGVASVNGSTGAVVTYVGTTGNIPYRYGTGVGITANSYFTLQSGGSIGSPTDKLIFSGATSAIDPQWGNTEAIGLEIQRGYNGDGLSNDDGINIVARGIRDDGGYLYGSTLRLTTPSSDEGGAIIFAPQETPVVYVGSGLVSVYTPLTVNSDITTTGNFYGTTGAFSKLLTASAGISASSVAVSGRISSTQGVTFGSATNFMAFVPQSSATNGGLWIKEGVFQIGGSSLLQGSGSVNYSGNTEKLYVYGYQIIENGAAYQGARTGLTVRGGTGQSVPLFDVTRGGTSAVQVDQNGTLVAVLGLSAAGSTFSGSIGLQNSEFIRNTTNGRVDIMPAPAGSTAYGMYFDLTSWSYGVAMGTIKSSDGALNNGNFRFDAPLTISNGVAFNLGSNGQNNISCTSTGLDTTQFSVNTSTGTNSGAFAIIDASATGANNRSPVTAHANPNLYVYRTGTASANDFIRVEHDGTNANIVSGGTSGILIRPGSGILGISGGISAAGATFSGTINCNSSTVYKPTLQYYNEPYATPTITANVLTVDLSTAQVFGVTLNAAINTFTISNTPATANRSIGFSLILTADGTARGITWGAPVKWSGGVAPTTTITNGKKDIFTFLTVNGGTEWLGFIAGQNF